MQCEPTDISPIETVAARTWSANSWRNYEALQMATYDDKDEYAQARAALPCDRCLTQCSSSRQRATELARK